MTEQRYNIVLLPPESAYSVYQTYAQEMFKDLNGTYLLGPKSLPHITLCQFYCPDSNLLKTVHSACASLDIPPYTPHFAGLNIAADLKEMPDLYWIGLNAIRESLLVSIHLQVRHLLERLDLACINRQGEEYRPHLTLANAYLKFPFSLAKSPNHLLGEARHTFKLTLGLCDNWGQFMMKLS